MQSNSVSTQQKKGHQRRPSIGKEMPISSLVIDLQTPAKNYDTLSRDGSSPDSEKPPMFFHLNDVNEDEREYQRRPPNTPTNITESRHSFLFNMLQDTDDDNNDNNTDDDDDDNNNDSNNNRHSYQYTNKINENNHLKFDDNKNEENVLRENFNICEFRKKLEIAEALSKTSMLMSPAVKRRLAARKVEMDFENGQTFLDQDGNDYVPPRELLIYLVRMGSFNSAPKINNVDSQDDNVQVPCGLSSHDLVRHCQLMRGDHRPSLLYRQFLNPIAKGLISNDITDGMRVLKLDAVSKVCSVPLSSPKHLRILQWNILSQSLGQNNDGFISCPDEALTWECRKYQIVQEIIQNDPDVVCLQEVDHFKFLQNMLGAQGYEGVFFPKPDSPCLYIKENNGPDGCAIFYKRSKFELLNIATRILEVWRVQSNQVAIAANFRVINSNNEFCVCTTHLKARHGALLSKLRNEQGKDLLQFVNSVSNNRPVILCGDFNAEPVEPVYSTVLGHKALGLSSAYSDIGAAEKINAITPDEQIKDDNSESFNNENDTNDDINKTIAELSAANEPPYTTWKIREEGEVCHTIDYVFYTKEQFKVNNCLMFPDGSELGKDRVPSFSYPSDHFSLVCDFEFKNE